MKPGRDFELAVYEFARKLDLGAKVFFDHHVPDRDTGTPRQCDAWIEGMFGNHWPVLILVSCKDHAAKLDISDITTFCGEIAATRAHVGVIYAKAGFTAPALTKARANNIHCCRLLSGEPAELPASIRIDFFAAMPSFIGLAIDSGTSLAGLSTTNDLFDLSVGSETVLDVVCREFVEGEKEIIARARNAMSFPEDMARPFLVAPERFPRGVTLLAKCRWTCYRARAEAVLLDGSYCISNPAFRGTMTFPLIDGDGLRSEDGWEEIDRSTQLPSNFIFAAVGGPDYGAILRTNYGPLPLKGTANGTG